MLRFSAQFAGPDSGHQASFMIECPECAWVQFWGPQSDSETGPRTREPNLVTRMGAQSSPTSDLNDWGRHCGSQNVLEFLWLQNSARSAARKLVTLLLLALIESCPESGPRNEAGSRMLRWPIQCPAAAQTCQLLD